MAGARKKLYQDTTLSYVVYMVAFKLEQSSCDMRLILQSTSLKYLLAVPLRKRWLTSHLG